MTRLKVAIATVGCRANQADSAALVRQLDRRLVKIVKGFENADVAIINTCCVTAEAERDCRKLARRALAASDDNTVVVIGCAPRAFSDFGNTLDNRVKILGSYDTDSTELADWVNQLDQKREAPAVFEGIEERVLGRTRALLKVQTGCSHCCAYCIVPKARGKERSMAKEGVLKEADRLAREGYKEVVLTGVQLGAWGVDQNGQPRLSDIVGAVADRLAPGRLRLSSIEPWSVDSALIAAIAQHDRICPHLHLPLQSGDDRVLAAMGRDYTAQAYLKIIDKIRKSIPDVAIGTDVLLGFPGEDDAAFSHTMQVLDEIGPAYVHAFPFSPRTGTKAATLPDCPKREVAKKRVRMVRAFGDASTQRFRSGQLGQIHEVIVEERCDEGLRGLTETFIPVVLTTDSPQPGELVKTRLEPSTNPKRLKAVPI